MDLGAALVSATALKESGARFGASAAADWGLFKAIMERPGSKGHVGVSFKNMFFYLRGATLVYAAPAPPLHRVTYAAGLFLSPHTPTGQKMLPARDPRQP